MNNCMLVFDFRILEYINGEICIRRDKAVYFSFGLKRFSCVKMDSDDDSIYFTQNSLIQDVTGSDLMTFCICQMKPPEFQQMFCRTDVTLRSLAMRS